MSSRDIPMRYRLRTVKYPIGSMYGIYANIGGILMVNVTIYSIHGSYGYWNSLEFVAIFVCCDYLRLSLSAFNQPPRAGKTKVPASIAGWKTTSRATAPPFHLHKVVTWWNSCGCDGYLCMFVRIT